MKKLCLVAALMVALMSSLLNPSYAILDKTRFVLDMGEAFFAFHHWVYNPYKAGAFASGQPGRTKALLKGGAATLFAVNRIKAANRIAHLSKSPTLQRLSGSLDNMTANFSSLGQKLKGGNYSPGDVDTANRTVNTVGATSAAGGAPIKDRAVLIPGM